MIAAGIGCRRNAAAHDIIAAVHLALARDGIDLASVTSLASLDEKASEPGLRAAAETLAKPLLLFTAEALSALSPGALTLSARVLAETGLPSVAETAALAAAGRGARLLGPRMIAGAATCALARGAAP